MKCNWNLMRKRGTSIFVAALLAATTAFATGKGPSFDGKEEIVCEEKPGPFAFTYAKDLGIVCPSDFYVYGEFLWMQAQEQGLELAVHNSTVSKDLPLSGGSIIDFSHGTHDWDWNPGFRIGFGAYIHHDTWQLDGKWTFVRIKDRIKIRPTNGLVIPSNLPSSTPAADNTNDASGRWRAKYNTFDLRLGKPFHVSRLFILNPFMGVRAGWIDQDLTYRYAFATTCRQVNSSQDYWGIGSTAGIHSEWILGAGWNLFGTLAGSILFGKYDISQEYGDTYLGFDFEKKFYNTTPNLELILGINWGHLFNDNKFYFSLRAAYEFHYWWHQNYFRRFIDTSGTGTSNSIAGNVIASPNDLSLNGASFRVQFDF